MKIAIDWHRVPEYQWPMHARLQNWARYVRVHRVGARAPMWRYTLSSQRMWHMPAPIPEVDVSDGAALEHAVRELPEGHRDALRWHYVYQGPPARIVRSLGVSYETLSFLVVDARRLLMNGATHLEHRDGAFVHSGI